MAICVWSASGANKVKLRGYVTNRSEAGAVLILDDHIEVSSGTRIVAKESGGEQAMKAEELTPGMLIEAEGQWLDKHKFFAEKISVELREDEKKVHGTAYLQEEPADAAKISSGEQSELKLDGYWLELGKGTKRDWSFAKASAESLEAKTGKGPARAMLAGYHVRYQGSRRKDGKIELIEVP